MTFRISLLLLALAAMMSPSSMTAQIGAPRETNPNRAILGGRDWGIIHFGVYGSIHSLIPFEIEPGIRAGVGIYKHYLAVIAETGSRKCVEPEGCTGNDRTYKFRLEIAPYAMKYEGTPYVYISHSWIADLKGFGGGGGHMFVFPNFPIRAHAEVDFIFLNRKIYRVAESRSILAGLALGITVLL